MYLLQPNVRTSIDRHGLSALAHFLFGPPKIHRDLSPERDLIFCVAGCECTGLVNKPRKSYTTLTLKSVTANLNSTAYSVSRDFIVGLKTDTRSEFAPLSQVNLCWRYSQFERTRKQSLYLPTIVSRVPLLRLKDDFRWSCSVDQYQFVVYLKRCELLQN